MFDVQFAPHPSEIVRWPWDRCGPWCDASGLQMLEPRDEVFAASEGVRRCARRHIALSVRFGEDSTMIFGLSPFLGYRFVPRLRDLPERRLASIARPGDYPGLKAIMGDIVAAVRAIQNEQIAAVRAVLERWSAAARASTGKRQAHGATAAKSALAPVPVPTSEYAGA